MQLQQNQQNQQWYHRDLVDYTWNSMSILRSLAVIQSLCRSHLPECSWKTTGWSGVGLRRQHTWTIYLADLGEAEPEPHWPNVPQVVTPEILKIAEERELQQSAATVCKVVTSTCFCTCVNIFEIDMIFWNFSMLLCIYYILFVTAHFIIEIIWNSYTLIFMCIYSFCLHLRLWTMVYRMVYAL